MSDWQPGDVCIATVRGVKGVRVFRRTDHWVTGIRVGAECVHHNTYVTNIRRLIVLDLDAVPLSHDTPDVVSGLRDPKSMSTAKSIAKEIEAQTKPPRIPEPGQWGVVGARYTTYNDGDVFYEWVKVGPHNWMSKSFPTVTTWDDLVDPVLVREGVES